MRNEISRQSQVARFSGKLINDIDISEKLRDVYLNRAAFIFLVFGYFAGIFGGIDETSKWIIALWVIVATAFIVSVTYIVCIKVSHVRQKVFKQNHIKEIEKKMI